MRGMRMSEMNVPKLRFGEFEGEWVERLYGDIYSFYSTNSLSRDKLNYEDGDVKNIHYGDIHTKFSTIFDIEKEKVPFINRDVDLSKVKDESYCQEGDLVIADASEDYADIGKTIELKNLNNEKLLAGLHTFLARPNKEKITIGFMGYLLQSWKIRKQVMTIAQGTKVLSLSSKRLANLKIDLPLEFEQQKIANFLTSIDQKINQLTQKKTLLESYKKGVMQKIFSQELRFSPTLVPTLSVGTSLEFEDWEVKRIGDLNIFISDGNYGEMYPKSDEMKVDGIPFIRANNIKNLKLSWKDMKYIDAELHSILTSGHLCTNDILVTTRGEIGMLAHVSKEFNNANINAQICLLRCKENLNSFYLLQYLSSIYGLKQFKKFQTGSALKQLPKKSLNNIMNTCSPNIKLNSQFEFVINYVNKEREYIYNFFINKMKEL